MEFQHHAYYIEGTPSNAPQYIELIRGEKKDEHGSAGFITQTFNTFTIADARTLIRLASLKRVERHTVFFIAAGSITSEAQQALLKLLEEPQEGVVFIVLVPHGTLMATLRSRMLDLSLATPTALVSSDIKAFLSWPYKKRSMWLADMLKKDEDNREWARGFLGALEMELYPQIGKSRDIRAGLDDIGHFRQYLSDRSPSLKMILEHFAATLPVLH